MKRHLEGKLIAVCLHPVIDRTFEVPCLDLGGVVRGRQVMVEAAGKGVNVAHTLAALGMDVLATGFLGRRDTASFEVSFDATRVTARFVRVAARTRESLTLVEKEAGRDTHILDSPMKVRREELDRFRKLAQRSVKPGDWVIFSGSCPAGVRQSDFISLIRAAAAGGGRVCVDTAGGMLRAAMKTRPWLIKPNLEELSDLVGRKLATRAEALVAARSLLKLKRCGMLLASLGEDGAILVTPEGAWHARETRRATKTVVHTVGCGDALLAGFLAAHAAGKSLMEALRYGVACGSACVRTPYASIRSPREVTGVLPKVSLTPLRHGRAIP